MDVAQMNDDEVIAQTKLWLEKAVIGLNLCPFAKGVHIKDQIRYFVSHATTPEALIKDLMTELEDLFEQYEKGSSEKLRQFLKEAEYKYQVGINEMVFKPSHSIFEFMDWRIVKAMFRLQMFQSMSTHVRKLFKNQKSTFKNRHSSIHLPFLAS